MRKFVPFTLFLSMLITPAIESFSQAKDANVEQITASQLRDYLTFVASDEMEGRNTPSRGLDTTALFISTLLSRWGAKPAGDDGTFFQKIILSQRSVDTTKSKLEVGGKSFVYGTDYFSTIANTAAAAPMVWAGNGWLIKSQNMDAFRGIDPKGKIVVVAYSDGYNPPNGLDRKVLTGQQGTDWNSPLEYAAQKGAAGLVYLVSEAQAGNWGRLQQVHSSDYLYPDKFKGPVPSGIPVFYVKPAVASALFQGEKSDSQDIFSSLTAKAPVASFALDSAKTATLTSVVGVEHKMTQNVVAMFEGSDPVLKNEFVAFGAHYDHIGMTTTPVNGDSIYNGADDDGSGTVSLISMAEALSRSKHRPRRSTLFVWHCGEEKGLWGSQYYTNNPTIPLSKIVTQLNIDMIGRSKPAGDEKPADKELSGPNEVYVIGSKMMSSELGELSERVNAHFLKVDFNYRYDDPKDPNGFFFRSDHFNYARKGVPIIFYFDGVHEDYHGLGDEVKKIDFQKMEKIVRTVYSTMWEISGLNKRPVVDKQLPAALRR